MQSISAPVLDTIHNYLYVSQNTILEELEICSLTHILQSEGDDQIPYYYILNNNTLVDQEPFCFSLGDPENLILSNSSITENSNPLSFIGKLEAEGSYSINNFTYYLTDNKFDNEYFSIENDSLLSKVTFDYEVKNEYEIEVGVFNQLGEFITKNFTINIEDDLNEDVQIVEILDDTLASLYYHQENFTNQTKLVFPNLTTVTGIAYFHQNVNLISVDLPKLSFVGDYMYFHGNEVMQSISAPVLDTIHNYLYVSQNTILEELEICSLTHIISTDPDLEAYYYINNNPLLDISSTCLDSTTLEFIPEDSLVISSRLLVGMFESNTLDSISIYINDDGINVKETEDFIIDKSSIYLKNNIEEYTEDSYPINITSYRMDENANTVLNEQILMSIDLNLKDKVIITNTKNLPLKSDLICYPIPTNSILFIKVSQPESYFLYDQTGTKVKTIKLIKGKNQIDLSKLVSGVYYLYSEYGKSAKIFKY
jgi:hypothetical protein